MTAGPGRRSRSIAMATQLAPLALVIVAEAAWISVVAGLLQEFALRPPVVGLPALIVFVGAGVVLARLLAARLGERWLPVGFGIVLAAGAVGWLLSPAARSAIESGIGPALAAHPGGWLAGLAVLRGFAHARLPLAEGTVARLLAIGVPGLAVAATLGGVIAEPHRTRFLEDALVAAIVYIGAAVLALAFTRIDAIGLDGGFDWRRNPRWLTLTVVVVAVAILVAIPLASVAGTLISVIVSVALGPLLVVGLLSGFDRTARRILGFFIVIVVALVLISRGFGINVEIPDTTTPASAEPPSPASEQLVTIGIGGLLLLAMIVGIIVVIALWMRRTPPPDGALGETRTIDPRGAGLAQPRRGLRSWRRPAPRTAVEAYVALVGDLDRHPVVRRGEAETPAAHAARLRAVGEADLSLDLLAADYALARYGGMALPAREDRRAVGRWRRLRKHLPAAADRAARHRPGAATTPDAERPIDLEPRRTF
jgi:hypothetical protein